MTNKERAIEIANLMNSFGVDPNEIAAELRSRHPTLQQTFTRVCVAWLKRCGKDEETMFDERNIASHKLGEKLLPCLEEAALPFI